MTTERVPEPIDAPDLADTLSRLETDARKWQAIAEEIDADRDALHARVADLEQALSDAQHATADAEAAREVAHDDLARARARITALEADTTRLADRLQTALEDAADANQAVVDLTAVNTRWREIAEGRARPRG